jgi:AcrR family transcriptional regulator
MAGRKIRAGAEPGCAPPSRLQRLAPEDRERLIIDGAVHFFADCGFGGNTRELARRLGITQPLLFRYFPTKELLIERVYEHVLLSRWNPAWEALLQDRSRPLRQRLKCFYKDYGGTILDRDWLRIFMYAGLKGASINGSYLSMLRERTLIPICVELRRDYGLPSAEDVPISEYEIELVWGINGRIVYLGVRKWIYQTPVPDDLNAIIEAAVDVFCDGAATALARRLGVVRSGDVSDNGRRSDAS